MTSSSSTAGLHRVLNFNAGPSALPLSVLERIREELLDWHGSGMSVMEMSHRSPEYEGINAAAEAGLRKHLGIPDDYAVIFLQGGASLQFAMVPMNLALADKPVDLIHTGEWTAKALAELKKGFPHRLANQIEPEPGGLSRLPRAEELHFSADASYVHLCSNNTIEGTQWAEFPDTGNVPLVADMSSDIASRRIDVGKFGLIFAGAQKNLGAAGVTAVIVRRELAERAEAKVPTVLQYRTHIKSKSLYHTPPTFAVYILGLMTEWIAAEGGVAAVERKNEAKAAMLYQAIDGSGGFYRCPVEHPSRSRMNVVFRVGELGGDEILEKRFADMAAAARIMGTPGHRSVGGMRASLYNAVTIEAVKTLVEFMREFRRTQG